MELSEVIKEYKKEIERKLSSITVKNYISDIHHFIDWTANKYDTPFLVDSLTKSVFDQYIEENSGSQSSELSKKSFKRHLSSLRSFSEYLRAQNHITDDPFQKIAEIPTNDPWKFSEFKNYLLSQKAGPLTVKYYINDVQSYARWCKETNLESVFENSQYPILNDELISEYAQRLSNTLHLSPKSINRKLSSLRRYAAFQNVYIQSNQLIPLLSVENIPLKPEESLNIAQIEVEEPQTTYSRFPPARLVQKVFTPYVQLEDTLAGALSARIIKSRLHSAFKNQKDQAKTSLDTILRGIRTKNIPKEFYAPHEMSLINLPLHKKLLHHAKYTRPQWYKRYHSYTFVHYVHFSLLTVFALFAAGFLYKETLGKAAADSLLLNPAIAMQKTFAFTGRLTDKNGNPITSPTDIRLLMYDNPTSSGSALLFEEVQQNVQPGNDGSISLTVGSTQPIPSEITNSDIPLYLGISVGSSEELTPRKQLGGSFANNSGKLFGMLPITQSSKQTNVVLALDGQGNLSIGGSSDHTFQASGGDFTLSGETLVLRTNPGASGNVVLSPYGNGKIDLQKALISSTGIIQAEGTFEIHATTSASPALSLKQDSSGDLISASTAGSTKFAVNNQGIITKGIWAGEVIGTEFGGFGANISATGPGELLYSTGSKSYGHLAAGKSGECLMSQGRSAPVWSSCNVLNQLNGALGFSNNTLDFVLGGNSTNSAKFAFINMTSSNPIFKIGGSLSFSAESGIENHEKDLKLGGTTTKNIILNTSSNIGIKNSNPTRTFDVSGNWGGNVDFHVDGAGDNNITRDTKALVYDLEKNTGTTNSSTTSIYNIVGLPNIDGTIAFIYAKVEKGATSDPQIQTITIKINDTQVVTLSTNGGLPSLGAESEIKHFTVSRSNGSWHLIGAPHDSDTADLAEWTEYQGPTPQEGMLVKIGENGKLKISDTAYDPRLAGIVSTRPNITIGKKTDTSTRLALAGRIPAIVASINGDIMPGDTITSSIIPGIGMKLGRNGTSVGRALGVFKDVSSCSIVESLQSIQWPYDDGKNTENPCFKIKVSNLDTNLQDDLLTQYGYAATDYIYIGKVLTLANLSWSESQDLIASLDAATITTDSQPSVIDGNLSQIMEQLQQIHPLVKVGGRAIQKIGVFSELAVGKIKTGSVIASNIGTNNLAAATAIITDLTVGTLRITDSLYVNGLSLKDYVASEFNNQDSLTTPLAIIDTVQTNTIALKDGNTIQVELNNEPDSALIIKNTETSTDVISLNSDGSIEAASASLSGELSSNSLNTNNATISGTLTTDKLIANDISGLDDRLTSIATNLIKQSKPQENNLSQTFDSSISQASVSATFGTFYEGLLSLGASTFGNLSVMDTLSVGTTLTFSPNSINTLGVDLEIQPLKQGQISFMAGAVKINIDGTLAVFEDALFHKNLLVKGNLSAHIVSPLPNHDLSVNLPTSTTDSGRFTVTNASNSAVLAVNSDGDVQASGSGMFSKIKFNLVGKAIASGHLQATATGSAGSAIIKTSTNELTIINPMVNSESLIYITPANQTQNQVLYLMRQNGKEGNIPGSFTVGVSGNTTQDILFNWLIVN